MWGTVSMVRGTGPMAWGAWCGVCGVGCMVWVQGAWCGVCGVGTGCMAQRGVHGVGTCRGCRVVGTQCGAGHPAHDAQCRVPSFGVHCAPCKVHGEGCVVWGTRGAVCRGKVHFMGCRVLGQQGCGVQGAGYKVWGMRGRGQVVQGVEGARWRGHRAGFGVQGEWGAQCRVWGAQCGVCTV